MGSSSPNRDEHKTYLKPPPLFGCGGPLGSKVTTTLPALIPQRFLPGIRPPPKIHRPKLATYAFQSWRFDFPHGSLENLGHVFYQNITNLQVGNILQHGSGVIYKNIHGLRICMFLHILKIYDIKPSYLGLVFIQVSVLFNFLLQLAKAWWSLLTKMVPFQLTS